MLRELMRAALLGPRFREVQSVLDGVFDPAERVARSAHVARVIYQSESVDLGGMRGLSAFSPALRQLEEELEAIRYEVQRDRIEALAASGRMKAGLRLEDARRIMWMYTSREVYRMLVEIGGWTPDKYQKWLAAVLVDALVGPPEQGQRMPVLHRQMPERGRVSPEDARGGVHAGRIARRQQQRWRRAVR
jgi:hypothetical protein